MGKRIPKEGTLLRINLADGSDTFARVLGQSQMAFYDQRIQHDEPINLSQVYESRILFVVTVMKSTLTSGRWKVVDHLPLEADLLKPREYFIKDRMTGRYSVYQSSIGSVRDSTFAECENLEPAAVWEPEHVEDRLRDHFAGRQNRWVEQLKATL